MAVENVAKVKALPSRNAEGHKDVVEMLETLLEKAKNGEIEAAAIATVQLDDDRDKCLHTEMALGYDSYGFTLYTAVGVLSDRLMNILRGNESD